MRLNEECVEKLMLYFEENLSCDTGKIKPIKLKQVYIQGFTDEEFFTAAQFCAVKGFISGPPGTKAIKDVPPKYMCVAKIEAPGWTFLDVIHSDGLMERIHRANGFQKLCDLITLCKTCTEIAAFFL